MMTGISHSMARTPSAAATIEGVRFILPIGPARTTVLPMRLEGKRRDGSGRRLRLWRSARNPVGAVGRAARPATTRRLASSRPPPRSSASAATRRRPSARSRGGPTSTRRSCTTTSTTSPRSSPRSSRCRCAPTASCRARSTGPIEELGARLLRGVLAAWDNPAVRPARDRGHALRDRPGAGRADAPRVPAPRDHAPRGDEDRRRRRRRSCARSSPRRRSWA